MMASHGPMKLDGTVLGFDVGARRIGVAVGSAFGHGARALAVIDVHGHGPDWTAIDRLRKEWRPGRPRGRRPDDPRRRRPADPPRAHAFARELHARYQLPVVLVDERASSIEAAQRFAATAPKAASSAATPRRWMRWPRR